MARRMREEWGSVTEIDRGKRYRLRYWAETPDGYKRVSETIRGTRRDAYNLLAQRRLEHSEDAPCPTVGMAYEQWWHPAFSQRVEVGDIRERTLKMYETAWGLSCERRWSSTPLDEIRALDIQQWLSGLSYNQAHVSKILLTSVIDYAVRYDVIKSNPFREKYVMPSKSEVEQRDKGIWTTDEVNAIWTAIRGEWFEPAFITQAYGGMRLGEALGLMPPDVAGTESHGVTVAVVSVQRQLMQVRREISDQLKTPSSRRVVPIPGAPGERLIELANECAEPYLTGDGCGRPTTAKMYSRVLRSAIADAGIPLHPLTSLRNSWQTRMRWEWKMPPYIIEPIMGHVVKGVTGMYYDRPTTEMLVDAVASAYIGTF